MAQIFKPKKNTKRKAHTPTQVSSSFTAMTLHSQAIDRDHEPVVIANGALPGETCQVNITQKRKNVWLGDVSKVLEPATIRKVPDCPHALGHFAAQTPRCGGCQFAYVDAEAGLALKQDTLSQALTREYGISKEVWTPPVASPEAYRRKVRLAIDARNANAPKIGFRQAQSKAVVPIDHCRVVIPELQDALSLLTQQTWTWLNKVGHIELLHVREGIVVVFHAAKPLPLQAFKEMSYWRTQLREKLANPASMRLSTSQQSTAGTTSEETVEDSIHLVINRKALDVSNAAITWLSSQNYGVLEQSSQCVTPAFTLSSANDLAIPVQVDDFMQVNSVVNTHMVSAAITALALAAEDRVLDLFCGSGNFTLPIASTGVSVLGVEGVASMVDQANAAALSQGLTNASFIHADLTELNVIPAIQSLAPNKLLLDPARQGAHTILSNMDLSAIERIVYVSCQPQTWLTDIGVLLDSGFVLKQAYCMDMFRETTHTELFSVLVKSA